MAVMPTQVYVFDELFLVEEIGEMVLLSHPKWGLSGVGHTVAEAQEAVLDSVGLARSVYEKVDLDPEAANMKAYMDRVTDYNRHLL